MRVFHYKRVRSTQDSAKRLAEAGAAAPLLIRADAQSAGRGREDRRFSSGKGGAYFSLLLRPALRPARLAALSRRVGHALARALARAAGVETAVKPPNDVLARTPHGWKKVAGVLIEARSGGRTLDWLVVGVGVNIHNRLPAGLDQAAALGTLSPRPLSVDRVLMAAAAAVRRAVSAR